MRKLLISVIVPVYNVEKYLNKCIESIVNQTYENMEIILVNDGSVDSSNAICQSWREKDPRIILINQNNLGAGQARNAALDIAKGDIVAFVDSDDYIFKTMFEEMLLLMKDDVDIVECDYITVNNNFGISEANYKVSRKTYTNSEAMKEHLLDANFKQIIWNKLYRKSIISEVRFPTNSKIDDEFFTYKVIGNANKLVHINKVFYAYRQNPNSIMHTIDISSKYQALNAKIKRHEYIKLFFPELINLSNYTIDLFCIYLGQLILKQKKSTDNKEMFNTLKRTIKSYNCSNVRNIKITNYIWIILSKMSLKLTCEIRNMLKIGL